MTAQASPSLVIFPPSLQIESDPARMVITVGEQEFSKPYLWRMPEWDLGIKEKVAGSCNLDMKGRNKFYAARLGPKFNRRFQAANYWLWVGNPLDRRTGNLLRQGGRKWQLYDHELVERAHKILPHIQHAERDGLFHLIPAMVIFQAQPSEIRKEIGPAAWRRIANNSVSRNKLIMQAVERYSQGCKETDSAHFLRLLDFPTGCVWATQGADEDEQIAVKITPRKREEEFTQTAHMVSDCRRMLGDAFNPEWGYRRMHEEHNLASRNAAARKYSSKPFAEAWSFEGEFYAATLLNSQAEIAAEGAMQRHCVASYAKQAERGHYMVLRIEGRERATAGFSRIGNAWSFQQIYGAMNAPVSDACKEFARKAALQICDRERVAA